MSERKSMLITLGITFLLFSFIILLIYLVYCYAYYDENQINIYTDKFNTGNSKYIYDNMFNDSNLTYNDWCVDRMRQDKLWRQGENAFLLVVTHSGHNPFTLPDGLSPLKLQGDYPKWLCDYLEVTAYVDAVLADFVTYVMSRPDADNTVIAIVGDHEGLGAHRREIAADSRFDFVDQEIGRAHV